MQQVQKTGTARVNPTFDTVEDEDFREPVECWNCGGKGFVIICVDDLCHGQDYCMHGDGEETCRVCKGECAL